MHKKDIYEHLANIYLDASTKRKNKKSKKYTDIFQTLFFGSAVLIFILVTMIINISRKNSLLLTSLNENNTITSELAFVLQPNIIKINFNFDPAKEETYRINLNDLDLDRFKALSFLARKANYDDDITLKVEFTDAAREKSEIQLYSLPSFKWQEYKINLSEFKNISNWSKMATLSFIIEEKNVKQKKGIVYLDNVRFLQ